ncbi:Queuosine biosynthesis QueD, PTPS-I [Dehalobacter sp. UNSWDHB]|uniref:6-carboxytetrahydropterin synthase QueD n=1 Tax=unclassified Dehalobacter TaxID=2635733 RepID=UPI00028B5643|nr:MULTISPECIES: 6-carboxytetrahydropterin synthase QueD [unclassified Dehalobacter]AFV03814.1 Queuosine biosynthesis QueD, PTPS-I [Dehalobacter sp. DCA]AFV06797.1 Queuosine biosynthesis QueD, PTPS-I [Dehalobacter sp. CF]EQB21666.1 Queuosine biosynthesis QueD, PTPS-I [Dehalobacter sp. UNSWDHB]
MYMLKVESGFDSAHFLAGHPGKCRNIHGHSWRVVVEIESETLADEGEARGMIVDFSQLKADLRQLADDYDHALLVEDGTLQKSTLEHLIRDGFRVIEVPFRTTAENFARCFYEALAGKGYQMTRVSVFETPANCAVYEGRR